MVDIIKQKLILLLKVGNTKTADVMTKETVAQMFQEFVDEITEKSIMFPRVLKIDCKCPHDLYIVNNNAPKCTTRKRLNLLYICTYNKLLLC